MFNDLSSPRAYLQSRRSGKPRDLVAPGPDPAMLKSMLEVAIRTPDHGKLAPWRFVIVGAEQRDALSILITDAYRTAKPDAGRLELEAMDQFARQAPALVVALYSPRQSHIPEWEQQLSCGAACMNLLHAAHVHGFAAGWLTGWPCYSDAVRDSFGSAPEKIAGFIFIGTPKSPLDERPRPDPVTAITHWQG